MKHEEEKKYRLITRSNLDGIISATLLKKLGLVDEVLFAHPKDVQDGKIKISQNDIVTNLPFVDKAYIAFDHRLDQDNHVKLNPHHAIFTDVNSVSELIYEYYGSDLVGDKYRPLIEVTNKSKLSNYSRDDISSPNGWDMLSFITDPRTGLGRFHDFTISNYDLMLKLTDLCLSVNIDEILSDSDVKERVDFYNKHQQNFKEQLKRCVKIEGDVAVVDLRGESIIYPGNRFMVYLLYPEISTSVHIFKGLHEKNSVIAIGKSIFNKNCNVDINKIVQRYDGGGHKDAGTCQVSHQKVDEVRQEIVEQLNKTVCQEVA